MACPRRAFLAALVSLFVLVCLGCAGCAEGVPVEGTGGGDTGIDGSGTTDDTGDDTGDGDTTDTTDTTGGDGDTTTTTTGGDGDGDGDATTTSGDGDGDGDPTTTGGDGDGDGDMPPPQPIAITLAHNNTDRIESGRSDSCDRTSGGSPTNQHLENRYYRVFALSDFGVTGPFTSKEAFVGIELAKSNTGSQPVQVFLYTLRGAVVLANLTQVANASAQVPDGATSVRIPIVGTFQPSDTLVLEFRTPDGGTSGDQLLIGTNSDGQTGPSYIYAPDCNVNQITDWKNIPPDDGQDVTLIHYVLKLDGEYQPPAP